MKNEDWISIRNMYPHVPGLYIVKDCRHDQIGTAHYNGYDWDHIEMRKGSLILCDQIVTHWMIGDVK